MKGFRHTLANFILTEYNKDLDLSECQSNTTLCRRERILSSGSY